MLTSKIVPVIEGLRLSKRLESPDSEHFRRRWLPQTAFSVCNCGYGLWEPQSHFTSQCDGAKI